MDFPKNIGVHNGMLGTLQLCDDQGFSAPEATYTRDDLIPSPPPEDKSLWGVSTGRLLQELFEREVMHNVCAKEELSQNADRAEADAMTKLWSSIIARDRVVLRTIAVDRKTAVLASVIVVDPAAPMDYTRFNDYYDYDYDI